LKTKLISQAFFGLIVIYFLQGSLYPIGSIISQGALSIILLINFGYLIKVNLKRRNPFFVKVWSSFIMFIVLTFGLTGDYFDPLFFGQLKNILFFMTSFFPIYYWTIKGLITKNTLLSFAIILLPVFSLAFYYSRINLIAELARENVVNNTSYYFVSIIPFLFFVKRPIFLWSLIFTVLAFLIVGAKRGSLIIGIISSCLVILYNLKYLQGIKLTSKVRNIFLLLVLIIFGINYFSEFIETNYYVFDRLEQNESKRPENYLALYNNWYNSNSVFNYLFGYGYFSSPLYTPEKVMAHNDWLEMLNDFGFFGILIYVLLFISFATLIKNQKNVQLKYIHFTVLLIWLFISLLSMWFNNFSNVIYAILIGFLIGNIYKSDFQHKYE
jgi:hypothetical protein